MKISDAGLELIRAHEGFRSRAYLCPAGIWTIGWGHTQGVKAGDTCTKDQAQAWLRQDVGDAEDEVSTFVEAPLTQGQFDALVSFIFNLGGRAFRTSTLLRRLNEHDFEGAAGEFKRWNKARVGGTLRELNGLTARRADERDMFIGEGLA